MPIFLTPPATAPDVRTYQLSILVEFDAPSRDDAKDIADNAKVGLQRMFPEATVTVRAGEMRWFPLDAAA